MQRFRMTSRATTAALLCALLIGALIPGTAAAATRPLTIDTVIGQECIYGQANDSASVLLVWRSAEGVRKTRSTVQAGPTGRWNYCSNDGDVVAIGDRLRVNEGTTDRVLVIPELTLFTNRDTDIHKGRGPAGEIVKLVCNYGNGFEPCQSKWRVRVNAQGQWSVKPGWDLEGDQRMFVYWMSPAGDRVQADHLSTHVVVTIGSGTISGSTRSGSTATVYLLHPTTGAIRGTAFGVGSPFDGSFMGRFSNEQGGRPKVRVGDRIESHMAADIDWIVEDIEATADVGAQEISGRCFEPGGIFRIYVYRNGQFVAGEHWWTDDEGPTFTMEYLSFQSGDDLLVWCPIGTGDWVRKWFAVP